MWYLDLVTDGVFDGELSPEQQTIKERIEMLIARTKGTPHAGRISCSTISTFENILLPDRSARKDETEDEVTARKDDTKELESDRKDNGDSRNSDTTEQDMAEDRVQERAAEQATKIQALEITIMKLENHVLSQKLQEQGESTHLAHLENQILRLENELLKLNQSYAHLHAENELLKSRQNKYLALEHKSTGEGQLASGSGGPQNSSKYFELVSTQQERLTLLSDLLKNQSISLQLLQTRSDKLEEQNQMLHQIVMNQTALISHVMQKLQEVSEQNLQNRQETSQLKSIVQFQSASDTIINKLEHMLHETSPRAGSHVNNPHPKTEKFRHILKFFPGDMKLIADIQTWSQHEAPDSVNIPGGQVPGKQVEQQMREKTRAQDMNHKTQDMKQKTQNDDQNKSEMDEMRKKEQQRLAKELMAKKLKEAEGRPVLYKASDDRKPKDCYELYRRAPGQARNGAYKIFVVGLQLYVTVYCDMRARGWTVLLKREDGAVDFYRDWEEYKDGFGAPFGDHYLGNEVLHYLTNQGHYSLKVDLKDWAGESRSANYTHFWLDSEDHGFKLHVLGYSGTAGDGLGKHDGMKFSTKDVDNDLLGTEMGGSCAQRFKGAGWYYKCYMSNLMGVHYVDGTVPEKRFDGCVYVRVQ
nr:hypothetical protein BaRGS_021094 [Batillaria attramentaria]